MIDRHAAADRSGIRRGRLCRSVSSRPTTSILRSTASSSRSAARCLCSGVRGPRGLRHGFPPHPADARNPALDAVHEDAAAGRCAGADLPFVHTWLNLLDTRSGLIIIYALMNLPIVVWMLFTFFKEVPNEILEAARMDGAGVWAEMRLLLMPLSLPGDRVHGLFYRSFCAGTRPSGA